MAEVRIGEVIGGYRLDRLIAKGGTGTVFAATHVRSLQRRAIKVIAQELVRLPTYLARFWPEAKRINELRHPNILDVLDFIDQESPRRVALGIELLEGPPLSAALASGPLTPKQAFNVTLQVADALVAAHAQGVLHRGIDPSTVMIIGDLAGDLAPVPSVKILDFAMSKLSEEAAGLNTSMGDGPGSPSHLAPEQLVGAEPTAATDVYALAQLFYELLSGKRLFTGDDTKIMKMKRGAGMPLVEIPRKFDGAARIAATIRACLVVEPDQRPSLDAFRNVVQAIGEEAALVGSNIPTNVEAEEVSYDDPTTADQPGLLPAEPTPLTGADPDASVSQVILDQILQDFGDGNEPRKPPRPAPKPPEAPLALESRPPQRSSQVAQELTPRRASLVATTEVGQSFAPIAVGDLSRAQPRRVKTVAIAGAAIIGLVLGVGYLKSGTWSRDAGGAQGDAVSARIARWAEDRQVSESFSVLYELASSQHLRDENGAYIAANGALESALVVDPRQAKALALWAENQLLWRGDQLTLAEIDELDAFLIKAASLTPEDPHVLRARGELDAIRGELTSAAALIARSIEAAPSEPRSRTAKAEVLLQSNAEQALALVDDATLAAAVPRSLRVKAEALARLGRTREALATLDKHPTAAKPDAAMHLLRARLLREAGQTAQALESTTLAEKHDRCRARLFRASLVDAAESFAIMRAIAGDASCSDARRGEAEAQLSRRDIDRNDSTMATQHAHAARNLARGDPLATLTLAEVALIAGDAVQADALIAANPKLDLRPDLATVRAIAAASLDNHVRGRQAIDAARSRDTTRYDLLLVDAVIAFIHEGDASAKLDALVESDPWDDADRMSTAAVSKVAFDLLTTRIKRAPRGDRRWITAGALTALIELRLERPEAAEAALASVRPVKPADDLTRIADGYLALAVGKPAEAEAIARGLLATKPSSGGARLLLARALTRAEKEDAAERALADAVSHMPSCPLAAAELRTLEWSKTPGAPELKAKITALAKQFPRSRSVRRLTWDAGL